MQVPVLRLNSPIPTARERESISSVIRFHHEHILNKNHLREVFENSYFNWWKKSTLHEK